MNHYNLDEKYAIKLEKVCKFIDEYRKKTMFNWFERLKKKRQDKIWDHLYYYTLSRVLENLIELYSNTWDKERVKQTIRLVSGINLEAYCKDIELREKVSKILNEK